MKFGFHQKTPTAKFLVALIVASFQAKRANIRYQKVGSISQIMCILSMAQGLAVGRTWLAVLENYQQEDGSIKIPKASTKIYERFDAF